MEKTTDWLGDSFDALLLRHLAQRTRDGDAVQHVVSTVLLSFVRARHEGLTLGRDASACVGGAAARCGIKGAACSRRCCALPRSGRRSPRRYISKISVWGMLFQNQVVHDLEPSWAPRRGMRPALTPDEEKAARLALLLTRLDRQEKILRRRALILAKRHSLEKAI